MKQLNEKITNHFEMGEAVVLAIVIGHSGSVHQKRYIPGSVR
jgi:hypothetical protein